MNETHERVMSAAAAVNNGGVRRVRNAPVTVKFIFGLINKSGI